MDSNRTHHVQGEAPRAADTAGRAGSPVAFQANMQPGEKQQPSLRRTTQASVAPSPPPPHHGHHEGVITPGQHQHPRSTPWHGGGLSGATAQAFHLDTSPPVGSARPAIQRSAAWGTQVWNNPVALTFPDARRALSGRPGQQGWYGAPSMAAAAQAAIAATCILPAQAEQNTTRVSTPIVGSRTQQKTQEQEVDQLIREGEAITARVAVMTKTPLEEDDDQGSDIDVGNTFDVDSNDGNRSKTKVCFWNLMLYTRTTVYMPEIDVTAVRYVCF